MPTTPLALIGAAFLFGMRHALDVDHFAAVAAIVAEGGSVRRASFIGVLWGLGHGAALLVVAVVLLVVGASMPHELTVALELAVAAMLVALGVRLLATLVRGGTVHHHPHLHGGRVHVHPHVHGTADSPGHADGRHHHHHDVPVGRRPFAVGVVHGLAGSAGLMLAGVSALGDPMLAIGYVVAFGAGAICGMVAVGAMLTAPLRRATRLFARAERLAAACAGIGSVAVGVSLGWRIVTSTLLV